MGNNTSSGYIPSHLRYMEEYCAYCEGLCPVRDMMTGLGSPRFVDLGDQEIMNKVSSCMGADAYFEGSREKAPLNAVSRTNATGTRPLGFQVPHSK